MVFLKTHSITRMCPVVDDLWGHVGGKSITKPPSSLRSLSTAYQPTCAQNSTILFIAAPANLQYLYINGVVPPEKQGRLSGGIQIVGAVAAALGLALGYSLWLGLKTSAEKGTRRTKRDWAAAAPFFAAAAALILASISLHKVVTLERAQREGSKKKEYDSVADEWVHQRVTESESDDDSVEALTVRTPLQ